jgi:hypothetical protein
LTYKFFTAPTTARANGEACVADKDIVEIDLLNILDTLIAF